MVHGDVVADPYGWMKDKSDPELLAYLNAENEYAAAVTEPLSTLADELYADLDARTQQSDLSVPDFVRHNDGRCFWYYLRTTEGLDYPSYHRAPATDRDHIPDMSGIPEGEQLLLDANELARDHAFFSLGTLEISPNGDRLAYSVDLVGAERYHLQFLDLTTGERLAEEVPEVAAGGCWCADEAFCYVTMDDAWRPDAVWRHALGGTEPDRLLLRESDEHFWLGVGESRDRAWVVISLSSKSTSEAWLLAADDAAGEPHVVTPRRAGIEYDVEVAADRLFIVHNDGAPDFALAQAPLTATDAADWEPLWPGEPGVRLLGVAAYDRALVLSHRREGLSRLVIQARDPAGVLGASQELEFDEPLFSVDADGSEDADTDRIRFSYQSMVTPELVCEFRLDTGERRVLKQRPVLDHPQHGPYRKEDYVQRREWALAPDGTAVPISLVHRADVALDGSAGCLLYGYGAYEVTIAPTFSIARLSVLDRGYVYAIAHVRGGGELGRAWYEAGRLEHKQNTFTDFLACAHHLVAAGYTRPERLGAEGGSAGGLLIGAVVNQAPDAFSAVHAAVPFVDALTTILDPDLPLTVMEWEEWGDPLHDESAYWRMKGYSPYENVRPQAYPQILVTASLNDTRVEVTEPAKWVARLRHDTGAAQRVLLKTELAAGHGGVSGRYAGWRDMAWELAWLIDRTTTS